MEFIQKLTNEDLINLNLHILKQNKKIVINTAVISAVALVGAVYAFIIDKMVIGIVFLVVMLAALIGIPFAFRALVKSQVTKNMKVRPDWEITVKVDDEGIYYAFKTEDPSKVDKYLWGDMYYAIDKDGYIYIQISQITYLIIKKEAASDQNELENFFKSNLKLNVRYFQKK